jgi:CRP-like cAMP-binding protein
MITTYDLLTAHPFLNGLSAHWTELLSHQGTRNFRHAGHRLFNAGHPARNFWLIRAGAVAIDTPVPGQGDVVVDTLGSGDVVGWSWMFPPRRWNFGAVALEDTLTIEFDAAGVLRLCGNNPELGYDLSQRFMSVMLNRLQATRKRLLDVYANPPGELPQPAG